MPEKCSSMPAESRPSMKMLCRGCRRCAKECGSDAITYVNKKAVIDYDKCKGCGRCIGACSYDAVYNPNSSANELLDRKMAEYAQAVCHGPSRISILHWYRISALTVTAMVKMMRRSFRISECSQALTRLHWIRPVQMPA